MVKPSQSSPAQVPRGGGAHNDQTPNHLLWGHVEPIRSESEGSSRSMLTQQSLLTQESGRGGLPTGSSQSAQVAGDGRAHDDQMANHRIWRDESTSREAISTESSHSASPSECGNSHRRKLKNQRLVRGNIRLPVDKMIQASQASSEVHGSRAGSSQAGYLAGSIIRLPPDITFQSSRDSQGLPASGQTSLPDGYDSSGIAAPLQALELRSPDRKLLHDEFDGDDDDQEGSDAAAESFAELREVTAKVRGIGGGVAASVGTAGHPNDCKPCAFVSTRAGCVHGVLCTFCHLNHEQGSRSLPSNAKRHRRRSLQLARKQAANATRRDEAAAASESN